MSIDVLPRHGTWPNRPKPPQGVLAGIGTRMLEHPTADFPLSHVAPMPLSEADAYPRDFTRIVVNLLDDARLALASNREAAKASLARASALLRDAADARAPSTKTPQTVCRGGLAQWQIRRVTAHVEACLMSTIKVNDLSEITRLSKSHFSRAFRASFGEPVHAYIIRRRMERARQLMLTTDQALSEIAIACGLSDQAHFSRLFRRVVGTSPNVWRRHWLADGAAAA
jgi:AraC family transcriptional regulator